ncbi:MAG: hypothetical protein JXP34_05640, partial [Planctomycetes bacterium]|nr:hypothetical protein [Planctomycetota bacterium]
RLAGAPPGAHVHVFDRGGSLVAVAWSGAGADLECPVRGDEATIADLLGRRSPVEASNGKARVRLSRSPIYVLDIEPSAKLEGPPHEPGKLPRNHPSPIVIAGRAEGLALQKDKNAYTVAGEPFDLRVDAYALREGKGAKGSIRIEVPEGWRADPDAAEVSLEPMGRESLRIRVTPGAATKDRQRIRVTGSFEGESPAPSVSHFLWKDGA